MNNPIFKRQMVSRFTVLFSMFLIFAASLSSFAAAPLPSPARTKFPICDTYPKWPGCGITLCRKWKTCGPCTGIKCSDWDEDRDGSKSKSQLPMTAPSGNRLAPPKRKVKVIKRPAIRRTTIKRAPTSKSRKPKKSTRKLIIKKEQR